MKKIIHPDGEWYITEYHYKGRKILIKSRPCHGMKAHIFYPNGIDVQFTIRYHFILPIELLEKAQAKIDLIYQDT